MSNIFIYGGSILAIGIVAIVISSHCNLHEMINNMQTINRTIYRKVWPMIVYNFNKVSHKIGFWITLCSIISFELNLTLWIGGPILYGFIILNRRTNIKETDAKIKAYDINASQIIDTIIDEAFNEYNMLNRGFKEKSYINATEEREIVNDMINAVTARISDVARIKLEAYYNKDMLPDIIATKVFLAVTAYVAENNKTDSTPTKTELDSVIKMF